MAKGRTVKEMVLERLAEIRRSDLVADFARDLLKGGVTEEQLHGMLQGKMSDPLVLELYNKYRDLCRSGWTFNRFGVRVTCH